MSRYLQRRHQERSERRRHLTSSASSAIEQQLVLSSPDYRDDAEDYRYDGDDFKHRIKLETDTWVSTFSSQI
eukprot:TRINITY_DN6448_c0_g1_i1.p1 TRINITY_DN6448_c0_g1~~TRINITY_DN6448_c0_g1_i1.p1  ORF type:complete len:72 (-),score=11.81 TRINITY_DN6448_c0_g1_i1:143-358(-)